ncbi:MAG: diguanylate cyclase [Myxococcales bacterium]|nr:diguanylate cyclase [Myxococcales bacterium]
MDAKLKILVGEGDEINRRILQNCLHEWGYDVLPCENGQAVWERFSAGDVHLVITDWSLPTLSGPDLVRKIRSHSKAEYTYIIMQTTHHDRQALLEGFDLGIDDYIPKPFNKSELAARVQVGSRFVQLAQERLQTRKRLEELATTDSLTGLFNRRSAMEKLEIEIERCRRAAEPLVLIMLDLDNFKLINDKHGHLTGDLVIRHIASLLRQSVRGSDLLARLGGEEFLIVLPNTNLYFGLTLAERLREAIATQPAVRETGECYFITASLGLALFDPGEPRSIKELIGQADRALYRAKSGGRNQICRIDG